MRHTFFALCFSLTASIALGGEIEVIYSQPTFIPLVGDHGVYSVQERSEGVDDPDRAIAYDNFTLDKPVDLTGIEWGGIWAEPLPGALSDVDFIVSIWGDDDGKPDLSGALLEKVYMGGNSVGQSGPDMTVVGNSDESPMTPTTPGGGPGADYTGDLPGITEGTFSGTTELNAGNYWISIIADQTFDNPFVVDPEWQWALGEGPNDGFYSSDRTLDPPDTPEYGILQESGDLAFTLHGMIVPEPSGLLSCLVGLMLAGLSRRRRA